MSQDTLGELLLERGEARYFGLLVCFLCAARVLIVIGATLLDQNVKMPKDDHRGS